MSVDAKIVELINAEIDGEISVSDRSILDDHLRSHPEASRLKDELTDLCQSLDSMEDLSPPPHLKHVILASLDSPAPAPTRAATKASSAPRRWWFPATPLWQNTGAFALGCVITVVLMSTNQIADRGYDDVTDLMGSIGVSADEAGDRATDRLNLTRDEVAGTITANRSGSIMVIDFDLSSREEVEIVVEFSDQNVWFNGFAQLESDSTSVAAESGRVSLQMDGQRKYAIYLHNSNPGPAAVNLQFYAAGELIFEDGLTFRAK
ncbi:MAG: anti-sigma factor [Gammaproteobacteria bacterium]|nr:anti-sigma factor [Gammaproteobacteria bacterium]